MPPSEGGRRGPCTRTSAGTRAGFGTGSEEREKEGDVDNGCAGEKAGEGRLLREERMRCCGPKDGDRDISCAHGRRDETY